MSRVPLGHLNRLNPRDAWANEAHDFTPWLAQEENFQALADTLHFTEAEVEATEQSIGAFSADIVARDRDGLILIENQLEQTDHGHLGQVLTYLAGLDEPAKVVWISTKVREEHRAAIDWLNANTPSDYAFFAVELEVFRIGDGPAAPHFHVAARPNEWSRHASMRRAIAAGDLSDTQRLYKALWLSLLEHLREHGPDLKNKKPQPTPWCIFPIRKTVFHYAATASVRDKCIGAELLCRDEPDKAFFDALSAESAKIGSEFGEPLLWERLNDYPSWKVHIRLEASPPDDQARWPEYFDWYADKLARFQAVFEPRVIAFEAAISADAEGSE
jgi:hypothetical protein